MHIQELLKERMIGDRSVTFYYKGWTCKIEYIDGAWTTSIQGGIRERLNEKTTTLEEACATMWPRFVMVVKRSQYL